MTASQVFSIASLLVFPMWLLMIFLPKWKGTQWLIDYKIVPILLSLIYLFYTSLSIAGDGGLDFGSLESVMQLFTVEEAMLAGWVHYLAFDLIVGMWILDQNKTLGLHSILMAPCLFFTFLLGPVGFLLFTLIKTLKKYQS